MAADPADAPASPEATSWRTLLRRLGPAGPLAVISATLPVLGLVVLIRYMNPIGEWLRSHGEAGVLLYAAAFALCAGLALVPTHASAILGGWAFGFAVGFPAALAGFLGGALVGYAVARLSAHDRVERVIEEKPTWRAVRDALVGRGFVPTFGMVTLARLNSPFAMTNLVMSSVGVSLATYALGTLVGMAPRTALVLYAAARTRELTAVAAADRARPWWEIAGGIALTLVVLGLIAYIANRAIARATRQRSS